MIDLVKSFLVAKNEFSFLHSNEYLVPKIGVDTAEIEHEALKVWGSLTYVIRNLILSARHLLFRVFAAR